MAFRVDDSLRKQSGAKFLLVIAPPWGKGSLAKRLFDIGAASLSLILLSPMIFIASVAIKMGSRGPVFSREILHGYGNRPIRVLRFRTSEACDASDRSSVFVSSIRRGLYRSGLDELPQLFDVLRGEMSIVGPPLQTGFRGVLENEFLPLRGVKPGMTGWSQIKESRDGFTTTEERIKDDLYYVQNRSIFLDIRIVFMTIFCSK